MRLEAEHLAERLAEGPLAALLCGALILAGCSSTCTSPDAPQGDNYAVRSCPDSVLARLNAAYVGMDSEAFVDCLGDSFSFWLLHDDWANPESHLPDHWDRSVEDTIHRNMFGDTQVVDRVQLTMYTEAAEFVAGPDTTDPYDDRWVYEQDVDLRITLGEWIFIANADQLFTFAREPGRADTLWWIVEWREVEPWRVRVETRAADHERGFMPAAVELASPGREGRVEDSSWGSIKAMFWHSWRTRAAAGQVSPDTREGMGIGG